MAIEQVAQNQVDENIEPSDRNASVGWLICEEDYSEYELKEGLIVVGRHPTCEISLDSVRISRMHCCIYINSGRVFIRDLNSTNGVKINGHRVADSEILDQDMVLIGHVRFRYLNIDSRRKYESERRRAERTLMEPSMKSRRSSSILGEAGLEVEIENVIKQRLPEAGDDCRVEVHVHWNKASIDPMPGPVD